MSCNALLTFRVNSETVFAMSFDVVLAIMVDGL
jgi:hypothetical protein